MCMLIWAMASMLDVPNFVDWGDHTYDMKTMACSYDRLASYSYTVFFITMFVTIPLFTVLICNLNIYIVVIKSRMRINAHKAKPWTIEGSQFDEGATTTYVYLADGSDEPSASGSSHTKNDNMGNVRTIKVAPQNTMVHLMPPTTASKTRRSKERGEEQALSSKVTKINGGSSTSTELKTEYKDNVGMGNGGQVIKNADKGTTVVVEGEPLNIHNITSVAIKENTVNRKRIPRQRRGKNMTNEIRLAKTLFIIFIVFCLCWTPYALLCLIDRSDNVSRDAYLFAILFAHSSSTMNSVLYAATNSGFRKGYRQFLRLCGFKCL